MSFNLGVSNHPVSRLGGLSSVGVYLYEDIYYRQWITEIALAFYEGRQDEFIWLDLVRQFRNPEKQQILPVNLTKEIIDTTSILYRNDPIYEVVDEEGKQLPEDQKLWEQVQKESRYLMFMDKLDRWTKLLGTVLVKVSFVDKETGHLVKKTEGGIIQLDALHGGVYDLRYGASPYYITELMIGFGNNFQGFKGGSPALTGADVFKVPGAIGSQGDLGNSNKNVNSTSMGSVNKIYWSPTEHRVENDDGSTKAVKNPYGLVPAVPFFNADPAHYYFLPINEPLIYANHALNMRITDLNHIAKFQSFGIPVVSGVERPNSLRQGRPVDDFNQLKGGNASSRFGTGAFSGFGAGGSFRTFDAGMGIFRDGNADANALGFSIGPDTAIAVGEKGDFKFEHPKADINGLIKTIQSMADMVRIAHGLRPKHQDSIPPSGFGLMMDKMGVLEENIRRGKLFAEREQQLFQVIKQLHNIHNGKSGEKKFSDKATLKVTYVPPEFPVDPATKLSTITLEQQIWDTGDVYAVQKIYPYKSEADIRKIMAQRRKDMEEQSHHETDVAVATGKKKLAAGMEPEGGSKKPDPKVPGQKISNRVKHSEESSKQPRKGDTVRKKKKDS